MVTGYYKCYYGYWLHGYCYNTLIEMLLTTGEHNASRHWSMERYISVSMLALVPAAVMLPSTAVVDYGLAVIVPIHGHWSVSII